MTYSYHIFYFPFQWEIPCKEDALFSEQTDPRRNPVQYLLPGVEQELRPYTRKNYRIVFESVFDLSSKT